MQLASRIFLSVGIFISISMGADAQEAEEKSLTDAFRKLSAYNLGKIDSLPRNAANYDKVITQLDNSFKTFILHPGSQDYVKFRLAKGSTNFKFFRLENTVEIDAASFTADSVSYVVFSYVLQDRQNYFIKRLSDNTIVFDGNGKIAHMNAIYALEKNKLLLVEEYAHLDKSCRASVVDASGKYWKPLKAFKGKAFGQVKFNYHEKKFVDKRTYFQLECGMEVYMLANQDVNKIYFDEQKKILSYKRYIPNSFPVKVEARYENGIFTIDDYNVAEDAQGDSTPVPF